MTDFDPIIKVPDTFGFQVPLRKRSFILDHRFDLPMWIEFQQKVRNLADDIEIVIPEEVLAERGLCAQPIREVRGLRRLADRRFDLFRGWAHVKTIAWLAHFAPSPVGERPSPTKVIVVETVSQFDKVYDEAKARTRVPPMPREFITEENVERGELTPHPQGYGATVEHLQAQWPRGGSYNYDKLNKLYEQDYREKQRTEPSYRPLDLGQAIGRARLKQSMTRLERVAAGLERDPYFEISCKQGEGSRKWDPATDLRWARGINEKPPLTILPDPADGEDIAADATSDRYFGVKR